MGQAKQRGTFEERKAQAEGMLDLALAKTGREVDMETVQILDQEAFGRMNHAMMETASRLLAAKREMTPDSFPMDGRAQDDGRLVIYIDIHDAGRRVVEVPAGGWRELTPAERAKIDRDVAARMSANPDEMATLTDALAKQMKSGEKSLEARREKFNAAMAGATQAIMIYDRSTSALDAARVLTQRMPGVQERVDAWLASPDAFFLCRIGQRADLNWTLTVPDGELLLTEALPSIAERIGPADIGAALLQAGWIESEGLRDRLAAKWAALGGKRE